MTAVKSGKTYLIRKDGLWLAGMRGGGISEIMPDGKREEVPTCVYSSRMEDARSYTVKGAAVIVAKKLGAEVITIADGKPIIKQAF